MKQREQELITSSRGGQSCLHVKHETGLNIYIKAAFSAPV